MPFVIGTPPATGVTLTASPTGPQFSGTLIRFDAAASGPSGSFEYQFLLTPPGGTASVARPYGALSFWTWDTTGSADGTYTITVQARTTGSTAPFEATASIPGVLDSGPTAVSLAANPSAAPAAGTPVTFTAAATGGAGPYEYEFRGKMDGQKTFGLAQAYGPSDSWTWTAAPGSWVIQVNARRTGSTAAAQATQKLNYIVTVSPATSVTLTPSPAGPQPAGTAITFLAAASGGNGAYEYEFLGRRAGDPTFSIAQAYSTNPSWTWNGVAGNWEIQVNARVVGSALAADATQTISYSVSAPAVLPATGVTVTATPASQIGRAHV
jgi:cell wall-associated protease